MIRFRPGPILPATVCAVLAGTTQAQIRERAFGAAITGPDASAGPTGPRRLAGPVERKSGGRTRIKVCAGGVLGNGNQIIASVRGGAIDFGLHGSPTLVGTAKEYGVLDLPFTIRHEQEADVLLDGPQGKALLARLEPKDLIGLGLREIGFRQITSSSRPADERKPIAESADEAKVHERQVARDLNGRLLAELGKSMTVNEVSAAEVARFAEKARPVHEKFSQSIGEDFAKDRLSAIEAIRTGKPPR